MEKSSKAVVCHIREKPLPMEDVSGSNSLYLLTIVYHDLLTSPDFNCNIYKLVIHDHVWC